MLMGVRDARPGPTTALENGLVPKSELGVLGHRLRAWTRDACEPAYNRGHLDLEGA